jgi:hypothetical protein
LGDIQYGREKFADAKTLYLQALEKNNPGTRSKFDVYGKLAVMALRIKTSGMQSSITVRLLPLRLPLLNARP